MIIVLSIVAWFVLGFISIFIGGIISRLQQNDSYDHSFWVPLLFGPFALLGVLFDLIHTLCSKVYATKLITKLCRSIYNLGRGEKWLK